MTSDRNGRAFEAILLEYLVEAFIFENINAEFTQDAINIQRQYLISFNQLAEDSLLNKSSKKLYDDYLNNVPQLANWIIGHFNLKKSNLIIVDKLKDSAAVENVADLILTVHTDSDVQTINLSLKNNHDALRHSRIRPVPSWLQFNKDHEKYKNFRARLDEIQKNIMTSIKDIEKEHEITIKRYDDLDKINTDHKNYSSHYKNTFIYPHFYKAISDFFKENAINSKEINILYNYFLSLPHYKIINYAKANNSTFEIYDFTNMDEFENLEVEICDDTGYLLFIFDSRLIISLRLHNDTSIIEDSFNYKCDIKLKNIVNLPINHYTLNKVSK